MERTTTTTPEPTAQPRRASKPESPSPSGDPWYDDPRNLAMLDEAIEEARRSPGRAYSPQDIRAALGL